MDDQQHTIEVKKLVEVLSKHNRNETDLASPKTINMLLLAAAGAAGALVWNTVIDSPNNFNIIEKQTTEIRTTVLEMRSAMNDMAEKLDRGQRDSADQQSRIAALELTANRNQEDISVIDDRLTQLEKRR